MTKNYHKYTEYTRHVDFKRLDFIVQSIRNHFSRANIKGLDLGCGEGKVTVPLASLGYSMVGIDISPNNIEAAKSKRITDGNPTFLVGNAENLTLDESIFDFVVCTEVLEHLNHPEKALTSINEILKENGLLVEQFQMVMAHIV
jgi:2-polyprenyl-3-methyl-5-hydroxy-6-metoxy-1,4-benzoquinol methylase